MMVGIHGLYAIDRGYAPGEHPFEVLAELIDEMAIVAWDRDMADVLLDGDPGDNAFLRFYPDGAGGCRAHAGPLGFASIVARWDPTSRRWVPASAAAARP